MCRPSTRPPPPPAYGALIEHFHQLTGVPVVLNTSFNDREPIVVAPAHALATLQACDLDAAASAQTCRTVLPPLWRLPRWKA
ncbi:carbamoyltransferase C-terminal domain-containing protein [Streptomyces mirabilis]|uniref:carbamoyltransferase C-terminal domain-containing protein n=1 Tax=Streptomyces mirabilis TaxID=68239 RepID=UPI0036B57803